MLENSVGNHKSFGSGEFCHMNLCPSKPQSTAQSWIFINKNKYRDTPKAQQHRVKIQTTFPGQKLLSQLSAQAPLGMAKAQHPSLSSSGSYLLLSSQNLSTHIGKDHHHTLHS